MDIAGDNVEVEHTGFGDRMCSAIGGVCIGILLFIGSMVLVFWNEGRYVKNLQMLNEAKDVFVSYPDCTSISNALLAQNAGNLVHVTCTLDKSVQAIDSTYNIRGNQPSLKVKRTVEQYQWCASSWNGMSVYSLLCVCHVLPHALQCASCMYARPKNKPKESCQLVAHLPPYSPSPTPSHASTALSQHGE